MNTETIATVAGGNNDKEEQCWTLLGLDRHEMDVKVMAALPVVGFKAKHMQSCEAKQEVGKDE